MRAGHGIGVLPSLNVRIRSFGSGSGSAYGLEDTARLGLREAWLLRWGVGGAIATIGLPVFTGSFALRR
jgi:hypothetical protein